MPPPSPLAIATSSINRLLKEETSYEKELANQQSRVSQLENNDAGDDDEGGNAEFRVRQEVSFSVFSFCEGFVWIFGGGMGRGCWGGDGD